MDNKKDIFLTNRYSGSTSFIIGKIFALVFVLVILGWSVMTLLNNFNAFVRYEYQLNKLPVNNDVLESSSYEDEAKKFEQAGLPYTDPQGRFKIEFISVFYSGHLVVLIYDVKNKEQVIKEANEIIRNAQRYVKVESIHYEEVSQ